MTDSQYVWLPADFGRYLRSFRKDSKKTLRQAAREIGCSHTWLSKVENNHELPGWKTLCRIAAVLDAGDALPVLAFMQLQRSHPEQFEIALSLLRPRT